MMLAISFLLWKLIRVGVPTGVVVVVVVGGLVEEVAGVELLFGR